MRIALDATYRVDAQPSGIAVYSREILSGLAAGHPNDQFVDCYRVKQWRQTSRPELRNVSRRPLLPLVATFRADVFHALNQRVDRRPAKRVVSTFHDLFVMTGEYSSSEFRKRFSEQARRAAAHSDFIIAVSEFTAGQVEELLGVDRSLIRVIYHGVRKRVGFEGPHSGRRKKIVLFVGALQLRKNVSRLVKAFEHLAADWRLVLAGAPTGYGAEQILDDVARSPCRDRIEVAGYLPQRELDQLYACASIFAFPSLDEGFGMPVLDAMAAGIPVVTSNRSALKEIADDAALLVDPLRFDELGWALERLAEDDRLRSELVQRGLARSAMFSWDRAVEQTYSVYASF